ncbi:hypothetical protein B0H21DRAFT_776957 [Amylocystis lapponica]|nr:hypothetical protein B0H21DRAFT_776957 [Amylocystis lapponica]
MSLPATLQGIKQVPSPSLRSADGSFNTPNQAHSVSPRRNQPQNNTQKFSPHFGKDGGTPTSHSPSQSRAVSPLRRLGWGLHRTHTPEEPFVPVDPFRLRICWFGRRHPHSPPQSDEPDLEAGCGDAFSVCLPLPALRAVLVSGGAEAGEEGNLDARWGAFTDAVRAFFADTLPRQIYLTLLLRLPASYWSRVARVFEDAEVSKPDVQRIIDACAPAQSAESMTERSGIGPSRHATMPLPFPGEWNPPQVSPALVRFKYSWEMFVDSLLREWKTLNLVSALLCTAILTIFQVDAAANDPFTRSAALFSLIFALMSLSYGCIYIVQFGTMRSMDRASRWAEEAQRSKTAILWNIWVLLATPAVWLAWSMISFCIAILAFIWRTGAQENPPTPFSPHAALAVRTALSVVFGLGLVNFVLIISTFSSYGDVRRERRRASENRRAGERLREGATEGQGRAGGDEVRGRAREAKGTPGSMVGLGLTGMGENGLASPGSLSLAGVVREEVDGEKGEFLSAEKGRMRVGKISPKL